MRGADNPASRSARRPRRRRLAKVAVLGLALVMVGWVYAALVPSGAEGADGAATAGAAALDPFLLISSISMTRSRCPPPQNR